MQNIRKNIRQTNLLKNNFKIIKNHTNSICHLSKLKDGRLISCAGDYKLNIYKKDTFELQLTIKEHTNWIYFFT